METIAGVIELKPNSLEAVEKWAETFNERTDEVVATLQDEKVQIESWFHLSLNEKDYLILYMRAESIERAQEVFQNSEHSIDAYHQQFIQDTWLGVTRARLLVDLVNDAI